MAQENVPADGPIAAVRANLDVALPETWNWAAYDHRTLYESVHVDNDPGQVGALAHEWVELGQEMADSVQLMRECLLASEEGWQGESAESARAAIRELADWSESAALTAAEVGQRVGDQAQIMAEARSAMPEPVDFDWQAALTEGFAVGGMAGFAAAVVDLKAKSDQASSAHQQAVVVMARMEAQSRVVDTTSPWFTPPPDPVAGSTPTLRRYVMGEDVGLRTMTEHLVLRTTTGPGGEVTAGEPAAFAEPTAGREPVVGTEPFAATEPFAGREPLVGTEPFAGREPLAAMPPFGTAEPFTVGGGAGGELSDPYALPPLGTAAGWTPVYAPSPGVPGTWTPDLDLHQSGVTTPQGALAPSAFTAPNPGTPPFPSTVDQQRPGWTPR
ncbi:MAG: PPE domain-containing protein, partial [Streptomycetaceae bacterium]|nr:PPE domain-containing protein [Streptomycetaceae bacterium]